MVFVRGRFELYSTVILFVISVRWDHESHLRAAIHLPENKTPSRQVTQSEALATRASGAPRSIGDLLEGHLENDQGPDRRRGQISSFPHRAPPHVAVLYPAQVHAAAMCDRSCRRPVVSVPLTSEPYRLGPLNEGSFYKESLGETGSPCFRTSRI